MPYLIAIVRRTVGTIARIVSPPAQGATPVLPLCTESRSKVLHRVLQIEIMSSLHFATAEHGSLDNAQVAEVAVRSCPQSEFRNKSVLLIVPDGTRTAPVGTMFKAMHACVGEVAKSFDVLIALGTHQPMSEAGICKRLEISEADRREDFGAVRFFNHEWNNPAALKRIGTLTAEEVSQLTDGLFSMDVPVEINRKVFEYDKIIIVGPVFPHEVVGFSGGQQISFPGRWRA